MSGLNKTALLNYLKDVCDGKSYEITTEDAVSEQDTVIGHRPNNLN